MKKLKNVLQKAYRAICSPEKQEAIVWDDLKALNAEMEWRSGIYEKERYIESNFKITDEASARFFFQIHDSHFSCHVSVIPNYPPELTTEIFILATHFNNLLRQGKVLINVEEESVDFEIKQEITLPLLYPGEIYIQIRRHQMIAKDIYEAFQRLVKEGEEPAIIIGDLLRQNREGGEDSQGTA